MRTATVIVTDLGARGNKIFHSGDTVTENNFPEGNFDKLILGGYIKENVVEVKEVEKPLVPKTITKKLTKWDLKNNPEFAEMKIGDEVEVPNPDYTE